MAEGRPPLGETTVHRRVHPRLRWELTPWTVVAVYAKSEAGATTVRRLPRTWRVSGRRKAVRRALSTMTHEAMTERQDAFLTGVRTRLGSDEDETPWRKGAR